LLEGKKINLRPYKKEDVPLLAKWLNNTDFVGKYFMPVMFPMATFEKAYADPKPDRARFIITTNEGAPAGWIFAFFDKIW
jgi:hypothetical protein